jgi:putative transcriptional regulator
MKTELQLNIINKIKNLRLDNELSQAGFSDILDISYGLIGNIESTKYEQKYTLKQIQKACEYFEFPIEEIFLSKEELIKSKAEVINMLINKIIEYYGQ